MVPPPPLLGSPTLSSHLYSKGYQRAGDRYLNFGAETKLFGVADNQSEREGDPFVKAVDTGWLHTSFTVPLRV